MLLFMYLIIAYSYSYVSWPISIFFSERVANEWNEWFDAFVPITYTLLLTELSRFL